jgi:hypothetical protein
MPVKSFFIIEDIPSNPVVAAVTGIAVGTIEACDFQIQLVQRRNITSKDDTADALKILSANYQGKAARKAVSDDLTAIIMLKESYLTGFMIAGGTNKAVLGNGN